MRNRLQEGQWGQWGQWVTDFKREVTESYNIIHGALSMAEGNEGSARSLYREKAATFCLLTWTTTALITDPAMAKEKLAKNKALVKGCRWGELKAENRKRTKEVESVLPIKRGYIDISNTDFFKRPQESTVKWQHKNKNFESSHSKKSWALDLRICDQNFRSAWIFF